MSIHGILIVTGPPAAGKSSVARAFCAQLPRAVHVDADVLQTFMITGRARRGEAPDDEVNAQIELRWRNLVTLARNYADAGFVVVVDDALNDRARLNAIVADLAPRDIHLVVLEVPADVARARDQARTEPAGPRWDHLRATIRQELDDVGLHLDNALPSADQSALEIRARWSASLISLA